MANATIPNLALFASNEIIHSMWALTRGLLAAGWKYKASSDALAKDTTGDMTNDRWATQGVTNNTTVSGQTGAAATIGAPSSGVSQITGLTGMVAASVGHYLTITGAATAANNGTWRIVSRTSATQVGIYNPAAVSDANNGSISWSEQYGGGAASVGAASAGRSTITGLTGMTLQTATARGSVGNRLTLTNAATGANNGTFVIVQVVSATSVIIDNTAAVSDANNGTITWTEMSPTAQVYPTSIQGATGTGAWVNLQGPSMMRIPIGTASPTGYTRGENVTQSSTGAQGELIGCVPDTVGGLGYIVIAPRVSGSTAGTLRGWSVSGGATDNIVGGVSGVTFTPLSSGTAVEYVQEIVVWKGNAATSGHVYIQCVDSVGESTSRFSVQSVLGTCTATICPGGATGGVVTTNGFASLGTMVACGTGGSGAAATGQANFNLTSISVTGRIQVCAANAIEASGVSADGSYTVAVGNPGSSTFVYIGQTYQRMDDCEEGDVWPYAYGMQTGASAYTATRTVMTNTNSASDLFASNSFAGSANTFWRGWRRRGFATGDSFQEFNGGTIGLFSSTAIIASTPGTPDRVACALTTTVVREPMWIVSTQSGQRMRKGTCRWFDATQGGSGNDTYDSKRWVQLSSSTSGAIAVGPWDGTTVPQNS